MLPLRRNLMAPDEMKNLGFKDDRGVTTPAEAAAGLAKTQTGKGDSSAAKK